VGRYNRAMFGSHLSISGGMHKALLAAEGYGMDTVQVFTKNQQQWRAKPLDADEITLFTHHAQRLGFRQIVAHASYLINLAAGDGILWEKSSAAFAEEMARCDQLGIAFLVVHPGSHGGAGDAVGIARVVDALKRLFDEHPGNVTVCLEATAGQGNSLGHRFEQLAAMLTPLDKAGFARRVALCVDTAHILAAGYDIRTAEGTRQVLAEIDRIIPGGGVKRVKAWHLNDSKKPLGSRVDRHEHLGRGFVGLPAFGVLGTEPRLRDVPKILETPKETAPDGRDWDEVNLAILRRLAAGKRISLKFRTPRAKRKTATRGETPQNLR
jgi:deoxyribonuclease IV